MPPCFEAGSGDDINSGLLKCRGFFGCCRGADGYNFVGSTLLQDFFWRNPKDKAEHRHLRIDQCASLIFKSRGRRIWFVFWKGRSQFGEMAGNWCKAPVECAFIRPPRAFVFLRYPQVHCKRLRVRERISAMTSSIPPGERLSAPNDPSPSKLETAAANLCEEKPPRGP